MSRFLQKVSQTFHLLRSILPKLLSHYISPAVTCIVQKMFCRISDKLIRPWMSFSFWLQRRRKKKKKDNYSSHLCNTKAFGVPLYPILLFPSMCHTLSICQRIRRLVMSDLASFVSYLWIRLCEGRFLPASSERIYRLCIYSRHTYSASSFGHTWGAYSCSLQLNPANNPHNRSEM